MYIHVDVYTCMKVCIHLYIYICWYVVSIYIHVGIYWHIYEDKSVSACIYMWMYTDAWKYVSTYTYIYVDM